MGKKIPYDGVSGGDLGLEPSTFLLRADVTPEHKPRVKLRREWGGGSQGGLGGPGGLGGLGGPGGNLRSERCQVVGVDTIVREREVAATLARNAGHITINISDDVEVGRRRRRGRSNSSSCDSNSR